MDYNSKLVGLATITTKPNKNPIFDGIWGGGGFSVVLMCPDWGRQHTQLTNRSELKT